MLHHVSVGVTDMERAARFYDAALSALGYKRVMEFMPFAIAYGESAPDPDGNKIEAMLLVTMERIQVSPKKGGAKANPAKKAKAKAARKKSAKKAAAKKPARGKAKKR